MHIASQRTVERNPADAEMLGDLWISQQVCDHLLPSLDQCCRVNVA